MNIRDFADVTEIARMCHEVNRAYCQSIGDDSQPKWKDAPEWQKDSAKKGVEFHFDHPGATPESSHENWMAEKIANGWQYGEAKDPVAKTHPCMLPYSDLPQAQRSKDYLFKAIINVVMEAFNDEQQ